MSKKALLNKIASMIEKKSSQQSLGMSFSIYLETPSSSISDPTHPDYLAPNIQCTTIRTRGYQPNDQQCNKPIHPQDEDTSNEPI